MAARSAAKAVVHTMRMEGALQTGGTARTAGRINWVRFNKQVDDMFKPKKTWWKRNAAPDLVTLIINSPGGSPAQSNLLYKRIRAKSKETGIPVVAVVEDVAASGGYYLACAADKIFVDECSVVGNIGVLGRRVHVDKLLEGWGIDAKTLQRGSHKTIFDPLSPVKAQDEERIGVVFEAMYDAFFGAVAQSRGARMFKEGAHTPENLKVPEVGQGEVFVGHRAVEAGLADAVGSVWEAMLSETGVGSEEDLTVHDFTPSTGFAWQNIGGGSTEGSVQAAVDSLHTTLNLGLASDGLPSATWSNGR